MPPRKIPRKGRPKSADSQDADLRIRCRSEAKSAWEKAASAAKVPFPQWVRDALSYVASLPSGRPPRK